MIVPLHPRHPFSSGLKYLLPILLSLVILILGYSNTEAHNIRGSASVQTRLSPNNPIHAGQEDHLVSLALAPEYYHRFDDGDVFTFLPFFRGIPQIPNAPILTSVTFPTPGQEMISKHALGYAKNFGV